MTRGLASSPASTPTSPRPVDLYWRKPASNPVNEEDPSGLEQCPEDTDFDSSQEFRKYTCLSINFTQLGAEIWIRQGSKPSFGLLHQQAGELADARAIRSNNSD